MIADFDFNFAWWAGPSLLLSLFLFVSIVSIVVNLTTYAVQNEKFLGIVERIYE